MAEEEDIPRDISWFRSFPPEDQVDLLEDPGQQLSAVMTNRLRKSPGLWWWTWAQGGVPILSKEAVHRLEAIKTQLDYWWEEALDAEQREYLLKHRSDELPVEYAEPVQSSGESPHGGPSTLSVVLVKDAKNNRFRLPSVIREFVELKAREAA
ncbi:hypothetical protein [Mycobacterium haemophilum]